MAMVVVLGIGIGLPILVGLLLLTNNWDRNHPRIRILRTSGSKVWNTAQQYLPWRQNSI